ncbi:probable cytochrome P450 313a3 [Drosophila ananassae]|nr:probable cytochrome P450 313a3 [Drosophila ananassae]
MFSFYICIFAAICFWIYFLWSRRRFYKLMFKVPGPKGVPLLGIVPEYVINKLNMNLRTKYMDTYGSTILVWLGLMPAILSRDPSIAEDVFTSSQCVDKNPRTTQPLVNILGNGILTLEEPKWNERRKQMNVSFKHNVLLSFFPIFNSETSNLVTVLDTFVGQGGKNVMYHLFRWSFRTALQTTMGTEVQQEESFKNDAIVKPLQSLLLLTILNVLIPLRQNKIISKIWGLEKQKTEVLSKVHSLLDKIIEGKIQQKNELDSSMNLVVDQVIELQRKGQIDFNDMRSECFNMVLAAFETTALTVNHALIFLAMFSKYQDTVFQELQEVFPTAGEFEVGYEDMQKLVYLDRVLNETLRLIPPIPLVPRQVKDDIRLSNGVLVPKGLVIGIDIFNVHRNKDHWGPDADRFNPDHFLPDNVRERHPYAFIPFSKGKRNCIGWRYALMSSKIALAKILRNYKVSTSFHYGDLVFVDNIGMKLRKSPLLDFQRRN